MNKLKLMSKMNKQTKLLVGKAYSAMSKNPLLRKYLPHSFITIEITTFCNLRCPGCYRTAHDYQSKNKNMSLNDFKSYIDQLPPTINLSLHGYGEPTINPDLAEMVKYAHSKKKFGHISFTTNALARKPEIYEKLFANGLTDLWVSVDSLDQQEVEKLRPGTNVKSLADNVKYLLDRFRDKISIIMVISNTNIHTFEETIKNIVKLGAKSFRFQPLEDQGNGEKFLSYKGREEYLKVINNLKIEGLNILSGQNFNAAKSPCYNIYFSPAITVDGYLTSCCRQLNKDTSNFGSLKNTSFKELYFSKQIDEIQKGMKHGKYPSFCDGCHLNHSG